jgi:molybdopterin converting factor small subunit
VAKVRVKAAGGVTRFMPGDASEYEAQIVDNTTVGEVLDALSMPRDVPSIILVNRETASLDSKLKDGDIVHLLPMVVGG